MLQIRPSQLDVLGRDMHRRFVRQLCADVREHFPGRCASIDDDAVTAAIDVLIETAKRYGITGERDVSMFVFLAQQFGDDFVQQRWAKSILDDERMPGADKAARLYERGQAMLDLAPASDP